MSSSLSERFAAGILGLEGLALLVVAGWGVVALVGGDSTDATSSIALTVLTVLGAVAVLAFAVATGRGGSWGRSGGIVTQLLLLAVAVGALTGPTPPVLFALGIAAVAVAGLVALVTAVRRAGARRGAAADEE